MVDGAGAYPPYNPGASVPEKQKSPMFSHRATDNNEAIFFVLHQRTWY